MWLQLNRLTQDQADFCNEKYVVWSDAEKNLGVGLFVKRDGKGSLDRILMPDFSSKRDLNFKVISLYDEKDQIQAMYEDVHAKHRKLQSEFLFADKTLREITQHYSKEKYEHKQTRIQSQEEIEKLKKEIEFLNRELEEAKEETLEIKNYLNEEYQKYLKLKELYDETNFSNIELKSYRALTSLRENTKIFYEDIEGVWHSGIYSCDMEMVYSQNKVIEELLFIKGWIKQSDFDYLRTKAVAFEEIDEYGEEEDDED